MARGFRVSHTDALRGQGHTQPLVNDNVPDTLLYLAQGENQSYVKLELVEGLLRNIIMVQCLLLRMVSSNRKTIKDVKKDTHVIRKTGVTMKEPENFLKLREDVDKVSCCKNKQEVASVCN